MVWRLLYTEHQHLPLGLRLHRKAFSCRLWDAVQATFGSEGGRWTPSKSHSFTDPTIDQPYTATRRKSRRSDRGRNFHHDQRCPGLWSREIELHHIRALLHSFEDNFTAVWGDVEVSNVEVGSEIGQLPLGACVQVDEAEVIVLNLASQEHECPSSGQEGQMSSPPSQGQGRQGMRSGLGRDGFHRERGADVGSRIDNEAAVVRPRGIDRVLPDKKGGRATVDRHAGEGRG